MKYLKAFYFLAQLGAAFVALLFGLRTVCGIFALAIPVEDAVIQWMYENAIVIGIIVAIGFLMCQFADACDAQDEAEADIWSDEDDMTPVEGYPYE